MAIIDLGKVKGDKGISVRNRGDWNKTAQYLNDAVYTDAVSHMGSLWTCLVTNTNIEPGKGKPQWNLSAEGVASVENNLTTTKVGSALDATQGKALKGITDKIYADKLVTMNEINLVTEKGFFVDALAVKELNSNLLDVNSVKYGDKTMIANQTRGMCNIELRGKNACINISGGQFPPIGTTAVNILRLGTDCRPALTQQGYFNMAGIAVLYIIKIDGTVSFQTLSGTLNTDASWNVVVHFFTV